MASVSGPQNNSSFGPSSGVFQGANGKWYKYVVENAQGQRISLTDKARALINEKIPQVLQEMGKGAGVKEATISLTPTKLSGNIKIVKPETHVTTESGSVQFAGIDQSKQKQIKSQLQELGKELMQTRAIVSPPSPPQPAPVKQIAAQAVPSREAVKALPQPTEKSQYLVSQCSMLSALDDKELKDAIPTKWLGLRKQASVQDFKKLLEAKQVTTDEEKLINKAYENAIKKQKTRPVAKPAQPVAQELTIQDKAKQLFSDLKIANYLPANIDLPKFNDMLHNVGHGTRTPTTKDREIIESAWKKREEALLNEPFHEMEVAAEEPAAAQISVTALPEEAAYIEITELPPSFTDEQVAALSDEKKAEKFVELIDSNNPLELAEFLEILSRNHPAVFGKIAGQVYLMQEERNKSNNLGEAVPEIEDPIPKGSKFTDLQWGEWKITSLLNDPVALQGYLKDLMR
ncbi:MAG: hypothetical protein JSS61_04755 [Verrucomicrobia bacterium]|nr:hypothetical protein [Verrucomicrobiota bacterium]